MDMIEIFMSSRFFSEFLDFPWRSLNNEIPNFSSVPDRSCQLAEWSSRQWVKSHTCHSQICWLPPATAFQLRQLHVFDTHDVETNRLRPSSECAMSRRWVRIHSKLKAQNSRTFQGLSRTQICLFQEPKLSTKSHILDMVLQNLECNVTQKCTVLY